MATSKRYNTYLSGTVGDIVRCTKIVLFNKKETTTVTIDGIEIALPYMTLTNLSEIWSDLKRSKEQEYVEIDLDVDEGAFIVDSEPIREIGGFYDIIYINSLDNTPSGYTEFFSVQGKTRIDGLRITLDFISNVEGDLEISIENTITRYSSTASDFIGNESWQYSSPTDVKEWLSNLGKRSLYGTHLHTILSQTDQAIYLDSGSGVSANGEYYPTKMINNVSLDPYEVGFKNYQVGYYWQDSTKRADLVLFSWVGQKYRIVSLVHPNGFGRPYEYTLSGDGYVTLERVPANIEILYFSGRYIILSDGTIYDTIRNYLLTEFEYTKYRYMMNTEGRDNRVIRFPLASSVGDQLGYLPKSVTKAIWSPTYLNQLVKVVGDWFIYQESSSVYVISGPRLALKVSESDLEDLMVVNSRVLWFASSDFVRVFSGTGMYALDKDLATDEFPWQKYPDKMISFSPDSSMNSFTLASSFPEYRRGVIPDTLDGFKFIGALGGFIFYTTTDKYLRYL